MLDIILVLLLVVYTAHGFARGFAQTGLTLIGAAVGFYLALLLGPWAMGLFEERNAKQVAAVVVIVFMVVACALAGSTLGAAIRARLARGVMTAFDRFSGGVVALLITALVMWGGLGVLRSGGLAGVNREIDTSRVYALLEEQVPLDATDLTVEFKVQLKEFGSPLAFAGNELIVPVPAPTSEFIDTVSATARSSSVRIEGQGQACTTGQAGTGWVIAQDRVMTNAHVVAGLESAFVQVGGSGDALPGDVVYFDPRTDIAILRVIDLPAAPLVIGPEVDSPEEVLMAGFPYDGDYDEQPLRVRSLVEAPGLDIYDQPGVDRDIYSLRGLVRPGNSGGALFDDSGRVVGMVFARSAADAETGYALRPTEFAGLQAEAPGLTRPVDTGACVNVG
ncbi:MarP family serine protease [Micrococcales bacterium 31B]|nr:MarP family serine protease [Micrococcales bacterium 31B]